ncbi:MAG: hypothetical protein H6706_19035 [Myxococcales bacterium]|nr:hypothetical protein [Myxococcales bacterium]
MNAERRGELRAGGQVDDGARVHTLTPVLMAVWAAADGQTSVTGLVEAARRADPTADEELVWQALDALADAGLVSRLAPPGMVVDRRAMLRQVASAAAAAAALALAPRGAGAQAPPSEAAAPGSDAPRMKEQHRKRALRSPEQNEKLAPDGRSEEEARLGPDDVAAREQTEKRGTPARGEQTVKRKPARGEQTIKRGPAALRPQEQNDKVTGAREQDEKRGQALQARQAEQTRKGPARAAARRQGPAAVQQEEREKKAAVEALGKEEAAKGL